VYKTAETKFDL